MYSNSRALVPVVFFSLLLSLGLNLAPQQSRANEGPSLCPEVSELTEADRAELTEVAKCEEDCDVPHLKFLGRLFRGKLKGKLEEHVKDFLRLVLQQYRSNVAQNIEFMQSFQNCMSQEASQRDSECQKIVGLGYLKLSDALSSARIHQSQLIPSDRIQAKALGPDRPPNKYLLSSPKVLISANSKRVLDANEQRVAAAIWTQHLEQIDAIVEKEMRDLRLQNPKSSQEFLLKAQANYRWNTAWRTAQSHHLAVVKELFERTPILMFLPKPHSELNLKNSTALGWSDSEIFEATSKALDNARLELARVTKDLQHEKIVFRRYNFESLKRHALDHERMWMDYIGFAPVVRQTLRAPENQVYCELANGIKRIYKERHTQNEIMLGAVFTGTGVAVGLAAGALGSAGALEASEASALALRLATLASISYGTIIFANDFSEYRKTRGQILSLTGLGGDSETPVADLEALQERQTELLLSGGIALHGMIKTGFAAVAIAKMTLYGPAFVRNTSKALWSLLKSQGLNARGTVLAATSALSLSGDEVRRLNENIELAEKESLSK